MQLIGSQLFKEPGNDWQDRYGAIVRFIVFSPSLIIEVTLGNFHKSGQLLVSNDVLNMIARESSMKGKVSFNK